MNLKVDLQVQHNSHLHYEMMSDLIVCVNIHRLGHQHLVKHTVLRGNRQLFEIGAKKGLNRTKHWLVKTTGKQAIRLAKLH